MGDAIPTGPTAVATPEPGKNEETIVEGQEPVVESEAGAQEESDIGNSESWVPENASEEFKGLVEKHGYESADDMAKALASLETKLGTSVQIPGKDASDDEISAFWKRMGRPDTKGDYDLPTPEGPDGYVVEGDFSDGYRQAAYENGLSTAQARKLWDWYNSRAIAMFSRKRESDIRAMNESLDQLKTNWGENYDSELAITKNLVQQNGDDELIALFNTSGLGNHPAMIRFVNNLAHKLGEDRLDGSGNVVSKAEKRPGVLNYDTMQNPTAKR